MEGEVWVTSIKPFLKVDLIFKEKMLNQLKRETLLIFVIHVINRFVAIIVMNFGNMYRYKTRLFE